MKFVQAKNYTPTTGRTIDLIVFHDMEYPEKPNGAEWCADFFAGPSAPKASAHYCVDNDSIVQCVLDKDVAWHAPGANHNGIGIEHAGYAKQSRAEWLDDYSMAELNISAKLVAELCLKYQIPAVRPTVAELKAGARGIVGHKDCSDAWKPGGHHDPGEGFPWDWYLTRVREHLAALEGLPSYRDTIDEAFPGWPRVQLDGATYAVSPIYVPFVGIGQAEDLALALGCELPTPALVNAIWKAADLRIDAARMVRTDHDGTMATMAATELLQKQAERIEREVGGRSLGVEFTLQAGTFKDVVRHEGKLGLYGWHKADGTIIQGFYAGHARGWLDYSQGLRLVRPI